MVTQQRHMRIPTSLIPYCPHCGKPMTMNLRCDEHFVQDDGWYEAARHYQEFKEQHRHSHILYLEIGVGYHTPGIIKYPFWNMTAQNPIAHYACINVQEAQCPIEIEERSICIYADIRKVLQVLVYNERMDAE